MLTCITPLPVEVWTGIPFKCNLKNKSNKTQCNYNSSITKIIKIESKINAMCFCISALEGRPQEIGEIHEGKTLFSRMPKNAICKSESNSTFHNNNVWPPLQTQCMKGRHVSPNIWWTGSISQLHSPVMVPTSYLLASRDTPPSFTFFIHKTHMQTYQTQLLHKCELALYQKNSCSYDKICSELLNVAPS